METMTLTITEITLDPRCQPRQRIDEVTVAEYVQAMRDGATFPPVTVYQDDDAYWLADGFHRITAAKEAGLAAVPAKIETGGVRAAMLHAVGANATHGLRRSNADKRRAVETLLGDDEWEAWSENKIAQCCHVTRYLVSDVRESLAKQQVILERTYTDRWGNTSTMNIENIGRRCTATVDTDTGEVLDEADEGIDDEKVDPTDLASYLPDGTPALAPFEDAMAQHDAWLAAIRGDIERMESLTDLRRICDTLETTATRMETLGIDAAETRRVHIRAMMHRGRAIKAVIAAGLEAAREAIAATTTPTGAQVRGWLDAITAAADLTHPDFEGIDEVQQFIDALEAIDRWINHERGYLVEAMRIIEGELEKKRTAMA